MHAQMSIMRDIIHGAVTHGANFKKLCDALGLDPLQLNDSAKQVPFKPAAEIWNFVIAETKDPLIGLHLGEELSPSILGMIGYLMQSSKTVQDSLVVLAKYNDLYSTMFKCTTGSSGDTIFVQLEPALLWEHDYPESARQSVEIFMSGLLRLIKVLSGKKIFPVQVQLAYKARSVSEYERIFQANIQFNANRNALVFRMSDLLSPVTSYDSSLFSFFNETLEQKLRSLTLTLLFSDKVKRLIIDEFKGISIPSIEIAAAHLNVTTRTLQRRLRDENTSYRDIVMDLRKELAQSLLKRPEFRVSEVADMLGYSSTSAFKNAMSKWQFKSDQY